MSSFLKNVLMSNESQKIVIVNTVKVKVMDNKVSGEMWQDMFAQYMKGRWWCWPKLFYTPTQMGKNIAGACTVIHPTTPFPLETYWAKPRGRMKI